MSLRRASLIGLGVLLALVLVLAGLWLARAQIAARFAERYFRQHGVTSVIEIGAFGLSGVSGRFALGPADAPELAAERIELFFDPLRWQPYLVEVRLVNPVVRARVDEKGRVTLPSLQAWLDSLSTAKEKSPYVSDDLAIVLTGLRGHLATPAGALEIHGDAKIVRNMPVSALLSLRRGTFGWQGRNIVLARAALMLSEAGRLTLQVGGDFNDGVLALEKATLSLTVERLRFDANGLIQTEAMRLEAAAESYRGPGTRGAGFRAELSAPSLKMSGALVEMPNLRAKVINAEIENKGTLSDLVVTLEATQVRASAGDVAGEGDITLTAKAALPADIVRAVRRLPVLAMEPPLGAAIGRNLGPFDIQAKAHVLRRDGKLAARLTAPLLLRTARGAALRIEALDLNGTPPNLAGHMRAGLSGDGLPALRLASQRFTWNGQRLAADLSLEGRLDFAVLRGIRTALRGQMTYADGAVRFTQGGCAPAGLTALGSLARDIKGTICPSKAPLFAFGPKGWSLDFEARDASGFLPLANADASGAAAHLRFNGTGGLAGAVTVTAARLSDKAAPLRFNPVTGSGQITLADGLWRGRFAAATPSAIALGTATFSHSMANGQGSAHVEAPLAFADGKLQPENLSPLLAPLRKAAGRADFKGDISWNSGGIASHTGTLAVRDFSFLTPLGTARGIDTTLNLTSLLPPATAPGQDLKIARIDWTLPLSGVDLRFAFSTTALSVEAFTTNFSEGKVTLAPFQLNPSAPGTISSTATLTGLSLAPLIAASNLSGKAALEGKLSGVLPFTAGPEGFRIAKGRLVSDGPGRLSLSRSLWGDTAVTNVVQDFAFQALEYLSFESLAADINSIAQGRLQVVFHIKGKSDPPRPQVADIPIQDIVNGTALQKPLPLPSGTPIDLTLDTSLNFDELLKSYAEAWSKSLGGLGAK